MCGGSKEADADKDKEAKAKADAEAAAKAKAAADAAAAAKAKAEADAAAGAASAAASAASPQTPTADGAGVKGARSSNSAGKNGARGSASGKGSASPRPSSGSKAPRGAVQPLPADHEANSSRDAPLVASRPDVDLNAAVDEALLKAKFKAFAEFGDGPADSSGAGGDGAGGDGGAAVRIDAVRFAKLCRDSGLVDGKKLPLGGVDVAFEGGLAAAAAKGLDVSGRKLDYQGFLLALELIAKALGVPLTHVQLWICASSPLEKSTQAQSLAASRPLEGPIEQVEPLKPIITANKLFKRRG